MKFIELASSPGHRLRFLAAVFILLVVVRLVVHAFGFSLGYLYLTLICLAGFWFGIKGGLIAASSASVIFLLEITLFKGWPLRDVVAQNATTRIICYYTGGLVMAILADAERKIRNGNLRKYLAAKKKRAFSALDGPLSTKDRLLDVTSSDRFRISFLIGGFMLLIIARLASHAFGFSLGYLYLTLICLAGFWFGIKGGILSAAAASMIFFIEVNVFRDWPLRDMVVKSMYIRMLFFFTGGIVMSYLSDMDRRLREKLKEFARYDELTNCVNFRWIIEILENEIARCSRYSKEMAVIMIDIDHFKDVNDKYGHVAGNRVLREFASVVKANVRSVDIVGRYGGEEFLIVLPEANHEQALRVLRRVKSKMMEMKVPLQADAGLPKPVIHFSAGIASFPLNGKGYEELINVADKALYQAKAGGRDRIVVERRRYIRMKPLSSLKVELVNPSAKERFIVLDVLNISQDGMLAAIKGDIGGSELVCRMRLPQKEDASDVKCRIVHKERSGDDLYLVGVSFVDAGPELKAGLSVLSSGN